LRELPRTLLLCFYPMPSFWSLSFFYTMLRRQVSWCRRIRDNIHSPCLHWNLWDLHRSWPHAADSERYRKRQGRGQFVSCKYRPDQADIGCNHPCAPRRHSNPDGLFEHKHKGRFHYCAIRGSGGIHRPHKLHIPGL